MYVQCSQYQKAVNLDPTIPWNSAAGDCVPQNSLSVVKNGCVSIFEWSKKIYLAVLWESNVRMMGICMHTGP